MRITPAIVFATAITTASHAVTLGFVESFSDDTSGFGAGGPLGSVNRSVGSVQPQFSGAADGFLEVTSNQGDRLAARAIGQPQYSGDYVEAGVTEIRFWAIDTGTPDDAVIRVGIGDQRDNFWVSNRNWDFTDQWTLFSVDLTDESQWTQVIGSDTFEDALRNTDVLQFRAAADPDGRQPDLIVGSFGIDNIALVPTPASAATLTLAALAARRRRR